MAIDATAVRWALAAGVVDGLGAAVARRSRLPGEPFGIRLPVALPVGAELALWGTATSAPLVMDLVAYCLMRRPPLERRRALALVGLGLLRLVGVACEPASWGRRPATMAATAMVPCHLAIATSQLAVGVAAHHRSR